MTHLEGILVVEILHLPSSERTFKFVQVKKAVAAYYAMSFGSTITVLEYNKFNFRETEVKIFAKNLAKSFHSYMRTFH